MTAIRIIISVYLYLTFGVDSTVSDFSKDCVGLEVNLGVCCLWFQAIGIQPMMP